MNKADWNRRPRRSSTNWLRRSTRFAIYARDGFRCVHCRAATPKAYDGIGLTVDHIVPRNEGGTNEIGNLVTACKKCNSSRQDKRLPRAVERKLLLRAGKPLNRELGRVLAAIFSKRSVIREMKETTDVQISESPTSLRAGADS